MVQPSILILGTRGVPAAHGGFETFAERLSLHLRDQGWNVGVYCQEEVDEVETRVESQSWNGIERIVVKVAARGPLATVLFDWYCVRDAARRNAVCLVLGYNGAAFLPYLRLWRKRVITNMDGIEWRRAKWGPLVKTWFWVNEWIAAWTSNRLVADHPAIADHLASRRSRDAIATIPYGGEMVLEASTDPLGQLGLEAGQYLVSIARIEPDNNILTLVSAFSRCRRGMKLVVLGNMDPDIAYHRAVRDAASDDVVFPGGIYDPAVVKALRFHARAYLHGHSVGGTNPSLVEALGAGSAVIAHDNPFNRWTAGKAGVFFHDVDSCAAAIDTIAGSPLSAEEVRNIAYAEASRFRWQDVFVAYRRELYGVLLEGPFAPLRDRRRQQASTSAIPAQVSIVAIDVDRRAKPSAAASQWGGGAEE
ncbi:DUF1972 domain-containing protein [Aurantimonas sp. VKM B-3413]|uniref:DUF1972 domain-containing protein n=1 Tax=Aurantimonas sp. VKM B-3413 TaxID=2779401 RepID=UPI001E496664|nr:DUF1972 domain-containing protein [Aurantimonas sp. VKM B-3413]MCB8840778.1 DUF1972 domain-containing protein [Aurantimonas sp. VKM B-3413]